MWVGVRGNASSCALIYGTHETRLYPLLLVETHPGGVFELELPCGGNMRAKLEQIAAAIEARGDAPRGARSIQIFDVQIGDEECFHVRVSFRLDSIPGE